MLNRVRLPDLNFTNVAFLLITQASKSSPYDLENEHGDTPNL